MQVAATSAVVLAFERRDLPGLIRILGGYSAMFRALAAQHDARVLGSGAFTTRPPVWPASALMANHYSGGAGVFEIGPLSAADCL